MHQALYRKWRPQTFEDVYGQEHITSVLRHEVENNKLSHAYLFCGPRGTGKTTCAKIIARAANCEKPVNGDPCGKCPACLSIAEGRATDVIEMDAASNNGVDNIRDLRESVIYTPADLKYRVYIIDEVHMLSVSAFNALLKTLEEPPAHVIFILATTELQKIPATVLSRCQRFDFRRVPPQAIISRMKVVCDGEKITADDRSLELIARLAQGSFRDALNMLEYCTGGGNDVNIKTSSELLGASTAEMLAEITDLVSEKNISGALCKINDIYLSSRDVAVFWRELISFCRDMLIYNATRGASACDTATKNAAAKFTVPTLVYLLEVFMNAENDMNRYPQNAKLYAEMALIRVCDNTLSADGTALAARITELEDKLSSVMFRTSSVHENSVNTDIADTKEENVAESTAIEQPIAQNEEIKAKPVLTSVRQWADIIKKLDGKDKMAASFLRDSSAYTGNDGKLVIRTPNSFAEHMFENGQRKALLCECVSVVLGREYRENDIIIVKIAKENTEYEPINELTDTEDD